MTSKEVLLGDIAWIDAKIVDPTRAHTRDLPHISGENITSITGELLAVRSAADDGMTSGKYQFDAGDVLYSKLRPYLRKVTIPEFAGLCSADMYPLKTDHSRVLPEFLRLVLVGSTFTDYAVEESARTRMPKLNREQLFGYRFLLPDLTVQRSIVTTVQRAAVEVEKARLASINQFRELNALSNSIVMDSVKRANTAIRLGEALEEVKRGIGSDWASHPVLGATREGLAPAKEQPGKQAPKYKPATPGTVFYNPMRILIGSIAMVDEDDAPGITSPDYVVLRGKPGVVDSRWFYHWLRSPLGAHCIQNLTRGAVRERMLFNRLAEGEIALPSLAEQQRASAALRELRPLKRALESRLSEINRLPQKILSAAFEM